MPFLSGAISKTVNMPNRGDSRRDHADVCGRLEAWLKALAIYRDGCKRSQPVNTGQEEEKMPAEILPGAMGPRCDRGRPHADDSPVDTHKFDISGHEGYLTVGLYAMPAGELFITMAKEGSTIGGLMDLFARRSRSASVWSAS